MKKAILSLSIIAISTTCLLNVAAASTINPATALHSKIVTDVKGQQPTMLTFDCPTQANVNIWFDVSGSLTSGGTGVSSADILVQSIDTNNGQWYTFGHDATDSTGFFASSISCSVTGDQYYRVAYNGNSQYAPAVSNVVMVTFS
jgi:hypothetical protein